jgi:hypothetical protein
VVAGSSVVGLNILISTYGWTHHHWCTCDKPFLKALPKSFLLLFYFGHL